MSDAPRKSRRVQEKQEAQVVLAKASEPAKKKRAQAPGQKNVAKSAARSINNAGHSRPMKRAKRDVDAATEEDNSAELDPKPKPKLRGDRGKLAQLIEFPLDVLLEVRSPCSRSTSAIWLFLSNHADIFILVTMNRSSLI
jgi:hypothetical protein